MSHGRPLLDRRQALLAGLGLLGGTLVPSRARAEELDAAARAEEGVTEEGVAEEGVTEASVRAAEEAADMLDGSGSGPEARPIEALRYRVATPGGGADTGGAILGVRAPIDAVTKVVLKYRKYRHILPRLQQSRVVGKKGDSADVYLRAPILGGVATIWGIARFTGPRPWKDKGRQVVGELVRGNLDAFHGEWKLYPCGPSRTILRLELYVEVAIPLPSSAVTPELEWACDKAVTAVRDMAECAR